MTDQTIFCPGCGAPMPVESREKTLMFRGQEITIRIDQHICPQCGLEAGTKEQACIIQAAISMAYRQKVGLLTGDDIQEMRTANSLTHEELASQSGFEAKEIACWEEAAIQTPEEDAILRSILSHG